MIKHPKIVHSRPSIDDDDLKCVIQVLKNKHLEDGDNVRELESFMKDYHKRKYAISCTNGFSAIHLALIGLKISEKDQVIIPSYACSALLNPILLLKAIPIIVDIEKDGFNISPKEVKKKLSRNTKAIIVPHTFGFPAQIEEIKDNNIPIIEDCAQSIGCKHNDKLVGTFSEISIFSFYATKMICGADGGIILTDDEEIYNTISNYRYYGHKKGHKYVAFNYQLTNLPAALALSQLKKLEIFIRRRKEIALKFNLHFNDLNTISINYKNRSESIYYRYPVKILDGSLLTKKRQFELSNIFCGFGVLEGLHEHSDLNEKEFPNTCENLKSILSIPLYPDLTEFEIEYIINETIKILK